MYPLWGAFHFMRGCVMGVTHGVRACSTTTCEDGSKIMSQQPLVFMVDGMKLSSEEMAGKVSPVAPRSPSSQKSPSLYIYRYPRSEVTAVFRCSSLFSL